MWRPSQSRLFFDTRTQSNACRWYEGCCPYRIKREVTYYGTNTVDSLNSAPVWRSAQLGLSLLWLCSLGHRRDNINYRPDSVPVGPNLTARFSASRSRRTCWQERLGLFGESS